MMKIYFILAAVILAFISFLKQELSCPKCGSKNLVKTGKTKYKESHDLLFLSSPESYRQIEYKCSDCKHSFWDRKQALRVS